MDKNWTSLKLQQNEITTLRSQMLSQNTDGGSQGYNCSHCKSALHGGGRNSCPWKDKTPAEAKKGAATFMVRMAEGAAAGGVP